MFLLIYELDSNTNAEPVCVLEEGEHIIGRGDLLKCNDKRASRTHAVIKIKDQNATITSTHQNPCFFQSANSTTVVILTKDVPTNLNDGDKFGIFPDQFWFKTKFEIMLQMDDNSCKPKETTTLLKRFSADDLNQVSSKVAKLENGNLSATHNRHSESTAINISKDNTSEEPVTLDNSIKIIKEELSDSNIENENNSKNLQQSNTNLQCNEINEDGKNMSSEKECLSVLPGMTTQNVDGDDIKPSCSGTGKACDDITDFEKIVRDRCWYGENCYRKSTHHKKEFSHPGDADYDSDPNDQRPICRHGAHCYRKNKDHLRDYRHPRTRSKPLPKCTCKKRRGRKTANKRAAKESSGEDDYDYSDPFINDDSEDNYEISCSECDTDDDDDWTLTNDVEEDNEDTGTLLKEAKRFIKEKKINKKKGGFQI